MTQQATRSRLDEAPAYDPGGHRGALRRIVGDERAFDAEGRLLPDRTLVRLAKRVAHPDRNDGDRSRWDIVDEAVRNLGLS